MTEQEAIIHCEEKATQCNAGKHREEYLYAECRKQSNGAAQSVKCPYRANDILYVRETWCWCPCWCCEMDTIEGCCDKSAYQFYNSKRDQMGCYGYKAYFEDSKKTFDKWHPSIHMPKEAARIFLKVTDVRMERLQDITEEDAEREGTQYYCPKCERYPFCAGDKFCKTCFEKIWNSTVDKKQLVQYGWDANPWIWVIEFERYELPVVEQ